MNAARIRSFEKQCLDELVRENCEVTLKQVAPLPIAGPRDPPDFYVGLYPGC